MAKATIPAEMAERIRAQRAKDFYEWAKEDLKQWRGRMSEEAYAKQEAYVETLKPELK